MTPSSRVALDAVLLELIRSKSQTARDLERATTSAHSVIARRLQILGEHGKIHFRISPSNGKRRRSRVWTLGPGPEAEPDPRDKPVQLTTKASPIGAQRDPLVAALFGPPSNAPRCIDCGVTQGAKHMPDCNVARFV